jgi:hypothetical protein
MPGVTISNVKKEKSINDKEVKVMSNVCCSKYKC